MKDTIDDAYATAYFPDSVVRDGVRGCCHQFAYAIHTRTGWKLAVLWRDPVIDAFTIDPHPSPLHVSCLTPNGRAVDVEGVCPTHAMIERWRSSGCGHAGLRIYAYDRAGYETAIGGVAPMLIPGDFAVQCAETEIAKSPAFLALIAELQNEERAPSRSEPHD